MPLPLLHDLIDEPRLQRAATALAARFGTAAELAQRAPADVNDFARAEAAQLAGEIERIAAQDLPTDADLRAALLGKPTAYEDKLRAREDEVATLCGQIEVADIEAEDLLRDVQRGARETAVRSSSTAFTRSSPWMASLQSVIALATTPPPPEPPSDATRKQLAQVAVKLVQVEAGRALVAAVIARIEKKKVELARLQRSAVALQRALDRVRSETVRSLAELPGREETLPFDLVLDGDIAVGRLLSSVAPIDWSMLVLEHPEGLTETTAAQLVRLRLADAVQQLAQLPFEDLLPRLLGDRSAEFALDGFVRNGSPLAPLRPKEALDGFHGLAIGVVEALDGEVTETLTRACSRARDVAIEVVKTPDLPDGVRARVVRTRGLLGPEALVSVVLDIYARSSAPTEIGGGATRDWEDPDLPELISQERLRLEIEARRRCGQPTALFERWLRVPLSTDRHPVPEAK